MDKLQELTDKLYQEGLSKGKAEGEALLEQARKEADRIREQAHKEADAIMAAARRNAQDYTAKVEGDLRMASAQVLQQTRKDIENLIITKVSDAKVDKALADEAFLKEIITAVATRFTAADASDLALVLPEKLRSGLEPFVKGELAKTLGKEVQATFSKKVTGGFTIGPKDGGWFISMTDQTFRELIGEYLRPATQKLLFG